MPPRARLGAIRSALAPRTADAEPRPAAAQAATPPEGVGLKEHAAEIEAIERPRTPGAKGGAGLTIAELMDRHSTPALSVAVVRDSQLLWAKAYGVADEAQGLKCNAETLFQAASISKPVSAMAVLRAVEDGLFELDAPINTQLRSWKLPDSQHSSANAVTARLLLSMTAGTTVHGFGGYHPEEPLPTVPQVLGYAGSTVPPPAVVNSDRKQLSVDPHLLAAIV